jgi:DNA-binding MarR family transcriptional regulator
MEDRSAAKEIWSAVAALFMSAENQDRFIGTADELGLSPPMLKALVDLQPGESRQMRSLAQDWGFDASFVTVIVDGLEQGGYADRRVAEHDRRVKTVELTDKGVAAREWALGEVYGPRGGFWDLTPDERVTLARLLGKLADAQAAHDRRLIDSGRAWGLRHGLHGGHRVLRGRAQHLAARAQGRGGNVEGGGEGDGDDDTSGKGGGRAGGDEPWRDHLAAHREELRRLRDELSRVRDEVRAQARRSDSGSGSTDDVFGDVVDQVVDEATAVADRADAVEAEVKAQLKGRTRPPG